METDGDEQLEGVRGERGRACVSSARTVNMFIYVHMQMSPSVKLYLLFLGTLTLFIDRQ